MQHAAHAIAAIGGGTCERAYSSTRICVQELQQFIGAGAANADLPHVYARTLLFAPHTKTDEPTPPHELVRKLHSWCVRAAVWKSAMQL